MICRNVIEIEDTNNKYDIEMAISDLYKRIAKLYNDCLILLDKKYRYVI